MRTTILAILTCFLLASCEPIPKNPVSESIYIIECEDICTGNTPLFEPTYIYDIVTVPAGKLTVGIIGDDGDFTVFTDFYHRLSSGDVIDITYSNVQNTTSNYNVWLNNVDVEVPDYGGFEVDLQLRQYIDPFIPWDSDINDGSGACPDYDPLTDECLYYSINRQVYSYTDLWSIQFDLFNSNKSLIQCI